MILSTTVFITIKMNDAQDDAVGFLTNTSIWVDLIYNLAARIEFITKPYFYFVLQPARHLYGLKQDYAFD